jgi:membrane protease YdiL (CAAX protease family)
MTGRLKQYPPSLQFAFFVGLFLLFSLLYLVFLVAIFPLLSGESLATLYSELSSAQEGLTPISPKVLGYLKLTQFLYTLTVYLLPPVFFVFMVDNRPGRWLRIDRKPRFLPVILGFLIMLLALPFVSYTGDWNHSWPFSPEMRKLEEQKEILTQALLNMPNISSLLINMFIIAVIPAIAEEFFFRGVVQRLFIQMMPKLPWLAVLIAAACFSAIHLQWMDFVPRLLLGFLLGAIYYLSGNLWLSILGHFLNNGLQVMMVYLYQVKMIKTNPMESTPTEWYIAAVSLALTIGAIWLFDKQTMPGEKEHNHREDFSDNIESIGK